MFSNHHEIMLILIFTSKLPGEGGELFFKKTQTQPYSVSIPINGTHSPGVPGQEHCREPLLLPPGEGSAAAALQGPRTPQGPALLREGLDHPGAVPANLPEGGKPGSFLTLGNLRGAGTLQHFVPLLAFATCFFSAEFILFIVFLPA